MTLYTIGYEGIDVRRFISLLREYGIETIVDVRELPLSRKPGFSKKALADALQRRGLKYVHLPRLGCPKAIRNRYRADGSWGRYKEGFLKHLNAQGETLGELASIAAESRCALLCFEANYNYCHRSMVAAAVHRRKGMRVSHIPVADIKTEILADLAPAFA